MSKLKLFLDGAELNQMVESSKDNNIQGFTTNPIFDEKIWCRRLRIICERSDKKYSR